MFGLEKDRVRKIIISALNEDIGRIDLTSTYLIPSSVKIKAGVTAHSQGIVAGLCVACLA